MAHNYNIFGVRHLSPGASFHLIKYLEEKKPKCILIEGPSDATGMIEDIAQKNVKPPIALLGYTTELPIETILYPFATYSPEYQAIKWGIKKKLEVRFIDLPTHIMLKLRQERNREANEVADEFYSYHNELYNKVAEQYNEDNYESYWERYFEPDFAEHVALNDEMVGPPIFQKSKSSTQWQEQSLTQGNDIDAIGGTWYTPGTVFSVVLVGNEMESQG